MPSICNLTENTLCKCGKIHTSSVGDCLVKKGAIKLLPDYLSQYNVKKAFVLADTNTFAAAGDEICRILSQSNIAYKSHVFPDNRLAPDEKAVGSAVMHYDASCDIIIAIGSGVINDIGKILSNITKNPYIIVATAPSMDGYASASSSMDLDGLKVSVPSKCPDVIIGDTDILNTAPEHMLKAGLGDMLAKYISICEWRISNLINGEYYCVEIASYIRQALKNCINYADGLLKKDEKSIEAVFEGLVSCGKAMEYAGLSRPASGVEHYFSHIWDMRGLEFGIDTTLHGIQCAYGTYISAILYEKIKKITPDKNKALSSVKKFDLRKWNEKLVEFLGRGANAMINQEEKDGKYDPVKHIKRLDVIIGNWDKILEIIDNEIPDIEFMEELFEKIGLPTKSEEIGVEKEILPMTFKATKDIRDKYVLSRLCWDLGIIDEIF